MLSGTRRLWFVVTYNYCSVMRILLNAVTKIKNITQSTKCIWHIQDIIIYDNIFYNVTNNIKSDTNNFSSTLLLGLGNKNMIHDKLKS